MRDERYLPFEGAGAISRWKLELPIDFKTFDYGTISDVILHLRFTARSADALRDKATASLKRLLGDATAPPLFRLISLRHEFPTEWYRFVSSPAATVSMVTVSVDAMRFPYFVQGKNITVRQANVIGRTESGTPPRFAVGPGPAAPDLTQAEWTGQSGPGPWTVATDADPKVVEDVFVVLAYSAS
jgi:hypothetical protein